MRVKDGLVHAPRDVDHSKYHTRDIMGKCVQRQTIRWWKRPHMSGGECECDNKGRHGRKLV